MLICVAIKVWVKSTNLSPAEVCPTTHCGETDTLFLSRVNHSQRNAHKTYL